MRLWDVALVDDTVIPVTVVIDSRKW